MIEIKTLALWSPFALVVFVSAIVLLEELSNARAMKQEKAAEARAQTETHRGHMTIEPGRYAFENKFDVLTKRRVS